MNSKCNVIVHRPELTPEEYEKRMENIRRATVRLVIAAERAHAKREKEERYEQCNIN